MAVTVVVNYMTASHKGSSGKSIAFPDVCKTPVLGVPVPIPYPNIAQSSDLADGSKDVKFDGESVVLKSSNLKRSMGDEAGVQKGLISSEQMGKAEFLNYSFDVKVEGENVCRLGDPASGNCSSLNTASFFHLQAGGSASGPDAKVIEDACAEIDKAAGEQSESKPTAESWTECSGIYKDHWDRMQAFIDAKPTVMLYFRQTGIDCTKNGWIPWNHQPKPHTVLDGNCLKASNEELVRDTSRWLLAHKTSAEAKKAKAESLIRFEQAPLDVSNMFGLVIRTSEASGRGKPQVGQGRCGQTGLKWKGQWMTGDYDVMDAFWANEQCQRLPAAQFNTLGMELNKAMGWPGIQHGYQTAWNTRKDPDFKPSAPEDLEKDGVYEFSVLDAISTWLEAVKTSKKKAAKSAPDKKEARKATAKAKANQYPRTYYAPGRVKSKLVDDKLTILGPGGGLYLEDQNAYWDALACCGCLKSDNAPKQDRAEIEKGSESETAKARTIGKTLDYNEAMKPEKK